MAKKNSSDDALLNVREAGLDVSQLTNLIYENLLKPKLEEEKERIEQHLKEIREGANGQAEENLRLVDEKLQELTEKTKERITASEKLVDVKMKSVDVKMKSIEVLKWMFGALIVVLGLGSTMFAVIGANQKAEISETTSDLAKQLRLATTQSRRLNKTADVYHEQLLQTILHESESVMARLSSHIPKIDHKRFGEILDKHSAVLNRMSSIFEGDASSTDAQSEADQVFRDTVALFKDVNRGLVGLIEVISLERDNPRLTSLFSGTEDEWQSIQSRIQNQELSLERAQKTRLAAYTEYALGTLQIHRFRKQRKEEQRLDNAQRHFETAEKLYPNFARSIGMQGFVCGQRRGLLEDSRAYKSGDEVALRDAMKFL